MLLAHLVLPPIVEAGMREDGDDDRKWPSFSICSFAVIDSIPEPTTEQKELFQAALKTLHLEPMYHNINGDPPLMEDLEVPGK